jgi:fructokinase
MGFEVAALGELLIDMVPLPAADGALNFAAKPGGAPGNAAVGLGKLGRSVCMLSKVGDDAFGRLLTRTIAASGAVTDRIIVTQQHRTGVAVVTLDELGDRDFLFYRQDCADANYTPAEVADDVITEARMLHVNSLVLSAPVSASAERHAIAVAKKAGIMISVDPNLRPLLWETPAAMIAAAKEVIAVANVLKVGADELTTITGIDDPVAALESLWHDGLKVAAITCAAQGAIIVTPSERVLVPGVSVKVVDTTGCGDSFMAAFLAGLLETDFDLSAESLGRIGRFACAAGAIVATVPGGMDAMPTRAEVDRFMAERNL